MSSVSHSSKKSSSPGELRLSMNGQIYGSSLYMAPAEGAELVAEAELADFAPCYCVCLQCFVPEKAKKRTYIRAYENRLEVNWPVFPCLCCSKERCIADQAHIYYYDKEPNRAGMCCHFLPAVCCGPPVIYNKSPRACCSIIDCTPCYGETIYHSNCDCFELRCCLCCGQPCYMACCSIPRFPAIKNGEQFLAKWKGALDAYYAKHGLRDMEKARFATVTNNCCRGLRVDFIPDQPWPASQTMSDRGDDAPTADANGSLPGSTKEEQVVYPDGTQVIKTSVVNPDGSVTVTEAKKQSSLPVVAATAPPVPAVTVLQEQHPLPPPPAPSPVPAPKVSMDRASTASGGSPLVGNKSSGPQPSGVRNLADGRAQQPRSSKSKSLAPPATLQQRQHPGTSAHLKPQPGNKQQLRPSKSKKAAQVVGGGNRAKGEAAGSSNHGAEERKREGGSSNHGQLQALGPVAPKEGSQTKSDPKKRKAKKQQQQKQMAPPTGDEEIIVFEGGDGQGNVNNAFHSTHQHHSAAPHREINRRAPTAKGKKQSKSSSTAQLN